MSRLWFSLCALCWISTISALRVGVGIADVTGPAAEIGFVSFQKNILTIIISIITATTTTSFISSRVAKRYGLYIPLLPWPLSSTFSYMPWWSSCFLRDLPPVSLILCFRRSTRSPPTSLTIHRRGRCWRRGTNPQCVYSYILM